MIVCDGTNGDNYTNQLVYGKKFKPGTHALNILLIILIGVDNETYGCRTS